MPLIAYERKNFRGAALDMIGKANLVLEEYDRQGFVLTLRQLYYQFVSRGWIPNSLKSYKRLGSIVNDARMAGLIDWLFLEDRTRNLQRLSRWDDPGDVIKSAAESYHIDLWEGQEYRVEVWIEKDALVGVIEGICDKWDVPFFSCRGYVSQSEMWRAGMRLMRQYHEGYTPIVLHLGDHDPSGIDMTRDIEERLDIFMEGRGPEVKRLALNMDQIRQYNPPPNPAKITDSRAMAYIARHGYESWELDALEPRAISTLIDEAVQEHLDLEMFNEKFEQQEHERELLTATSNRWSEVEELIDG